MLLATKNKTSHVARQRLNYVFTCVNVSSFAAWKVNRHITRKRRRRDEAQEKEEMEDLI